MPETLQEVEGKIIELEKRIASAKAKFGEPPETEMGLQYLLVLRRELAALREEENALRADAKAAAAERSMQQKVALMVTHWATGIRHVVEYEPAQSLEDFLRLLSVRFDSIISRIYHIPPNELWNERQKLDTDEKLREAVDELTKLSMKEAGNCLYVSSDDNSPTSSPKAQKVESSRAVNNNGNALPSQSDGEAGRRSANINGSTTSKSSSSTQAEFRVTLLIRDEQRCLVCSNIDASGLEAAHVIDLSPKDKSLDVSQEQLQKTYHLGSKNEWKNGLLLCRNCHAKYDNFDMGIDGEGDVHMEKEDDAEEKKNIFIGLDDERRQGDYPSKLTLEWKYNQFKQKHRSGTTSSLIDSSSSLQPKISPKKRARASTQERQPKKKKTM